jgi:hypothetical protein
MQQYMSQKLNQKISFRGRHYKPSIRHTKIKLLLKHLKKHPKGQKGKFREQKKQKKKNAI